MMITIIIRVNNVYNIVKYVKIIHLVNNVILIVIGTKIIIVIVYLDFMRIVIIIVYNVHILAKHVKVKPIVILVK